MALSKLEAHARNIALHHSVFALPFAYMGAFFAADGVPTKMQLFWITLAMVGARSAALALNNLIDLKYDKLHPRFTKRPMVTGEIKKGEVILLIVFSMCVFAIAVYNLNPICFKLLPLAALPFFIYPYMKRISFLCHGVLGLAIAMAPAGGYVAISGEITFEMIILCTAVGIWIGAFDAVYGAQDEEFDRTHGLHSLATQFSPKGALIIARICHLVSIVFFAYLGFIKELSFPYFMGVGIATVVLIYQHSIVSVEDFSRLTQMYFMRNGIVSIAMFFCTWISFCVK